MKFINYTERGMVFFLYAALGLVIPLFSIWIMITLVLSFFYDFTFGDVINYFLAGVLPAYLIFTILSPGLALIILKIKGARRPRLKELGVLVQVIAEVDSRCQLKRDLTIAVIDDHLTPNAMVLGNSLIFTTGLINQSTENELLGVVAHEFGHLFYGDSNFNIMISILMLPYELLSMLLISVINFCKSIPFLYLVIGIPLVILSLLLFSTSFLISLFLKALSRKYEYRADQYAVDHGFGDGLKTFLEQLQSQEGKKGFLAKLLATHPSISKRLLQIDKSV